MWSFFFVNLFFVLMHTGYFAFLFWAFSKYFKNHDETLAKEKVWLSLLGGCCFFFIVSMYLFCSVSFKNPGRAKGIDKNLFYIYLDKAIKENRNMDYFCFFCRTIWSSSGVHCMTCGTCVEGFDHHCTFVDNCIGFKNHPYFLSFLGSAGIYTLFQILINIWVLVRHQQLCN